MVLAIVVAVCKPLGNSKEVNKSVLVGYVMNAGILWLSTIMLFAWKIRLQEQLLPTLTVIQSLGISWLQDCLYCCLVPGLLFLQERPVPLLVSHDLKRLLIQQKRYRCSCRTFNCHYGTVHADFNRGIGCHRIKRIWNGRYPGNTICHYSSYCH